MNVDLNADVGESFGRWELGDDDALLAVITSANVACGFHAGDPTTLRSTVHTAAARGVTIGAQVGYRDLAGFGRRFLDVAPVDLTADVLYQLGALDGLARTEGTQVRYLKPHGALYHATHERDDQASAVVDALLAWDRPLAVLAMPGSRLLELADTAGLPVLHEGFVDRAYDGDRLRPRTESGAVLEDPDEVTTQAVRLAHDPAIDSLCLHGDTPGAAALATQVRDALVAAGVSVTAAL